MFSLLHQVEFYLWDGVGSWFHLLLGLRYPEPGCGFHKLCWGLQICHPQMISVNAWELTLHTHLTRYLQHVWRGWRDEELVRKCSHLWPVLPLSKGNLVLKTGTLYQTELPSLSVHLFIIYSLCEDRDLICRVHHIRCMDLVGGQEIFVKLNEWIASLWVWFSYLESDGADLSDWLIHLFIHSKNVN